MSVPFRDKSPSTSSGNSDSVDGASPGRGKKSGSFGTPKSSKGKLKLHFKGKKQDRCELSPQTSTQCELSPQPTKSCDTSLTSSGQHETSPQPSEGGIPKVTSNENFFSFTASEQADVNIWGEDFTSILKKNTHRKLSLIHQESQEATPLQEGDSTVENIGVAYVEPNRTSKVVGQDSPDKLRRATSPPTLERPKKNVKTGKSVFSPQDPVFSLPVTGIRPRTNTDSGLLGVASGPPPLRPHPSEFVPGSFDRVSQLEKQIDELKIARWKPPAIPDTIDRILTGESYCLEWYKSPVEKRALLDAAIATNDGNCITAVLLFIRKTVNQPILLGMLAKRPVAVRHYASFLRQLGASKELSNLYMRMDYYESLGNLKLHQCEAEMDASERFTRIRSCHTMFKSSPQLQGDAQHVDDYARITDKQKKIEESEGHGGAVVLRPGSVLYRSIVTTLLYCCRYHRHQPESATASPVALRRHFNISEKQYFQMYLLALCIDEDWDSIDSLVSTKGFMGMGKKKKSPIGFERIVKTLAKQNMKAPPPVLKKYLLEIEDIELRFQLATEVQVFDVGLDCLKQLRDRERVRTYINHIPSNKHWDYRKKIDDLLKNSQIRWK